MSARPDRPRVLVVDNYDSFVFTLAAYLEELGAVPEVVRHDAAALDRAGPPRHDAMLLSPGPCGPHEAGRSLELIGRLAGRVPILGVCLGHQCIAAAFGARVGRARRPMHGRTSCVEHDGTGVFEGLPSPIRVTRYHSLIVEPESLPACLRVTAHSEDGEIMALAHRDLPIEGVQFHPEAVLTEHGHHQLARFLDRVGRRP